MGRLPYVFFGIEGLYLGVSILATVFSVIVRFQDDASPAPGIFTLRRMAIGDAILNGGLTLGIIIFASFVFGIVAFLRSRKIGRDCTRLLHIFNWTVVISGIVTLVVGCMVWAVTLNSLDQFAVAWQRQTPAARQYVQNALECCGYWNSTSTGLFNTSSEGFCASVAAGKNSSAVQACVAPISQYEDALMSLIFTTLFGTAAVEVLLVLVTSAIIKVQCEQYRFTLIDAKRGGKDAIA